MRENTHTSESIHTKSKHEFIHIHTDTYTYIRIYIRTQICTYVLGYTYIYIHKYIFTEPCICIFMHLASRISFNGEKLTDWNLDYLSGPGAATDKTY